MASLFGFGASVELQIKLFHEEDQKKVKLCGRDGQTRESFLFQDRETLMGHVWIVFKKENQTLEHHGIRVQFIGRIETYNDNGYHEEIISVSNDIASFGILSDSDCYGFEFRRVNKPFDSYYGKNVKLRYFLRVTMRKKLTSMTKEMEIIVQNHRQVVDDNASLLDMGIPQALHIEFRFDKHHYDLSDVIIGDVTFKTITVKLKFMDLELLRMETVGHHPMETTSIESLGKWELMDGNPVCGVTIPIRVFLAPLEITTQTMKNIAKIFSVKYFLKLNLVDTENRTYYKQTEVFLYRKGVPFCPFRHALELQDGQSMTV